MIGQLIIIKQPEWFPKSNGHLKLMNKLTLNKPAKSSLTISDMLTCTFEFFTVCTKLAEMAILYSKDLTTAKKKKLPPVGLDLVQEIITGL